MKPEEIVAREFCISHEDNDRRANAYRDEARAALRALSEQGYAVVPVEPTREMVRAAWNMPGCTGSVWRAMLDAAGGSTSTAVAEEAE